MRPIYYAPESYPRYVGSSRGVAAYKAVGNQSDFSPLGHIPQVAHTFGYFEQTYGALNEHQVGIGESTCSGVFGTSAVGHGGKALMSIDTLSQLAMERATSSRAAVELMGSLAEKYGFYGAGSFEGSAESLMVTDPQEGYIFHILPDPTGTSAIWAARRVPDDEVGVVANVFVIRGLNMSEPGNYLCSKSVHEVAQAKGWWKPADGLLDFTATFSDGEYAHKYYSGRRVWGVYQKLAPSLNLSPTYGEWRKSKPYPVSAKPDHKLSVADVAAAMRSYYEGTAYDQTVGLAAGPFGTPDHVSGGSAGGKVVGNWERTIGLYRTSDSHIVQSRHWLPSAVTEQAIPPLPLPPMPHSMTTAQLALQPHSSTPCALRPAPCALRPAPYFPPRAFDCRWAVCCGGAECIHACMHACMHTCMHAYIPACTHCRWAVCCGGVHTPHRTRSTCPLPRG